MYSRHGSLGRNTSVPLMREVAPENEAGRTQPAGSWRLRAPGRYTARLSAQIGVILRFQFQDADAWDVDYIDYH